MEKDMLKKEGLLFVVSGPSGSGKTSLCRAMLEAFPGLRFSVSHTTRPRRPGDQEGRDYHFISPEEFQGRVDRGDFLEWAEIYGHRYGTSKEELRKARAEGRDLILDIDGQGVRQLREQNLPAVFIFILPPSLAELGCRLRNRKSESADALAQRLRTAREEIAQAGGYDYLVVNDDLARAREELKGVILAERCRRARMLPAVENLLVEK